MLVDTSIWVDHIRQPHAQLARLLEEDAVVIHPFIIGELVLGKIRNFAGFLRELKKLRAVSVATPGEVLDFIARHHLSGSGVGYIDAHLLASCLLTANARLWTRDKWLHAVAARLSLAAER